MNTQEVDGPASDSRTREVWGAVTVYSCYHAHTVGTVTLPRYLRPTRDQQQAAKQELPNETAEMDLLHFNNKRTSLVRTWLCVWTLTAGCGTGQHL